MPNPKVGTVTMDVTTAVKNAKAGQVQYRTDKAGIIHAPSAALRSPSRAEQSNLKALIDALVKAKPAASKGQYLRRSPFQHHGARCSRRSGFAAVGRSTLGCPENFELSPDATGCRIVKDRRCPERGLIAKAACADGVPEQDLRQAGNGGGIAPGSGRRGCGGIFPSCVDLKGGRTCGSQSDDKKAVVAEVSAQVANAQTIVVAEYRGIEVTDLTVLRKKARESGVYLRVLKNTLVRRAVAGSSFAGLAIKWSVR
jgi:hypothetical protein